MDTPYHPPLIIVAAMSRKNRGIGMNNGLLWHVPADLKRFKALTLGHPIIMGRKTFESIVAMIGKPLPGRTTIVITRDESYTFEGVLVAHSLAEAIAVAQEEHPTEIHIGGGAQLYQEALPLVSRLHITWFDDAPEADTFFPPFEDDFEITTAHEAQNYSGLTYQWVDYSRKSSGKYSS
jgi:dihydrofolate reductase